MSSDVVRFFGVRPIPLNQIINVKIKDIDHINNYVRQYLAKKKFFAPVYVQIEDGMYKAVANSALVNAAKNLGHDSVLCKYGTQEEAIEENKYRQIGSKIRHKNFGSGEIVDSDEKSITVLFDDGKKRNLSIQDKFDFKQLSWIKGAKNVIEDNENDENEGFKIVNLTSIKGDGEYEIEIGYNKNTLNYVINKRIPGYKNSTIELSSRELTNIFIQSTSAVKWKEISDNSVIYDCEEDDVEVVFRGVEYSVRGLILYFEINCDKPSKHKIYLKDLKTNDDKWISYEFVNFDNNNIHEVHIEKVDIDYPCEAEFCIEVMGPGNYRNSSQLTHISLDFENDDMEVTVDTYDDEEEEIHTIDFRTFLIRSDYYKDCEDHDVESVKAIVYLFDGYETIEKEIPAFYCNDCNVFYIKESTFQGLKKYGRILCPILSLAEYREMKKHSGGIGSNWAKKSILKMYGYSANSEDNLSSKTRRTILEYIIDSEVLKKQEVIDYLLFFIKYHPKNREAIAKWESDIDYITGYKTDFSKKKVGIIYK